MIKEESEIVILSLNYIIMKKKMVIKAWKLAMKEMKHEKWETKTMKKMEQKMEKKWGKTC